jgi:FkbM family methyltransferase
MHLLRKARVAITPRQWLLRTRLADGTIIMGRNKAGFGGRGIYIHREGLEPELELLPRLLTPGSVFIDVGANTGVYSLVAARIVGPGGIVISLEPFVEVLATLRLSVEANGLRNVRLRNICAGRHTTAAELWMNRGKPNSFSLLRRDDEAEKLSTLVVTLDELSHWERLERIDYIKIDAEGAEDDVLAGASGIIQRFRPLVQIEVTVKEPSVELAGYTTLCAKGSANRLLVPANHPKILDLQSLGWLPWSSGAASRFADRA